MDKATRRSKMQEGARRALALGLSLISLVLANGSLGNLSRALSGTLAVVGLLGYALLSIRASHIRSWSGALALLLMAGSLPIVAHGEPWSLLAAAVFVGAVALATRHDRGLGTALFLTALFFALYRLLVTYVPPLWYAERGLALYFSWFAGAGLRLGPSALGLPNVVLFALLGLSVFLLAIQPPPVSPANRPGRRKRVVMLFIAWLVVLALVFAGYLWLQPPLVSWLVAHWPELPAPSLSSTGLPAITYLETPLLLFCLLWLASALVSVVFVPRSLSPATARHPQRWALAGLSLLALGTVALSLDPPLQPSRGTILVYDTGTMAWNRPAFGRYGAHSSGAFGLLPDYLAAYGYEMRTGTLAAENLAGAQVVVMVNLPHRLGQDEKERLLAFVEAGGGLVIWGEHTVVSEGRPPVDDLLAGLPGEPIHLRFDSAVPIRQGWAEGLALLPHPPLYGLRDPLDLVVAVGASLDIRLPARPLIVGRYGHSDAGDAANQARNYVGDMRYNPGERLGDVVLAAEVAYGRGRIVVLGDTTPLGSVNLMTTMPFQARLLDWVTAQPVGIWHRILRNGWLAGALLLGAAACLVCGRSLPALVGAAFVLGAVLYGTTYVDEKASRPPLPAGPIAYVEFSHQERFDRLLWEDTSIGGLSYNLARNGTLPLLLRHVDDETLSGAQLLVVVAPGQPFSAREIATIARWVEGGGRLLVSVGWEESEASQPLLSAFGLQVDPIPLGPAEAQRATGTVTFHEAWPVVATDAGAQAIVSGYGYPLLTYQPWGQGGVALVGDSEFLLGGTLEGETRYREGNILFLRDVLQATLGLGAKP